MFGATGWWMFKNKSVIVGAGLAPAHVGRPQGAHPTYYRLQGKERQHLLGKAPSPVTDRARGRGSTVGRGEGACDSNKPSTHV